VYQYHLFSFGDKKFVVFKKILSFISTIAISVASRLNVSENIIAMYEYIDSISLSDENIIMDYFF